MTADVLLLAHPSVELYGADRMFVEAVLGLEERGWSCHVVLPGEGPLAVLLRQHGIVVVLCPVPVLRKALLSPRGAVRFVTGCLQALPRMLRLLRDVAPAAVYVSTLTVPVWLLAARARRLPVLCHVHEAEDALPALVRTALVAPLLLADRVLANSAASQDVIASALPRLSRRTQVLYNGVPGPADVVEPRARLGGPVRLVLVGRLSPRKGPDVAVEAVRLLCLRHDVTLDLVGGVFPGYEWFEDELRAQVLAAGLQERVLLRGEQSEPWSALARADIALVPSRTEPFGNTAVEAMLAKRPLVATAVQGLREVVSPEGDDRHAQLAESGDALSLAAAVETLLMDWPAALLRAEVALQDARRRFAPTRYRTELAETVARTARSDRPGDATVPPR